MLLKFCYFQYGLLKMLCILGNFAQSNNPIRIIIDLINRVFANSMGDQGSISV